jgi:flagellar motility protein MotE (MotC chaperone)
MKRRAGRGALVILALFLASSGALRIGSDVGAAMANSTEPPPVEIAVPETCAKPPVALALALQTRESEVRAQEVALEDRLAALALAEEVIAKRLTELQTAETDLKETLSIADGAAEEDLTRLTAVYEAMKPADAARIFATMAPEFAAGFLSRMRPEAAAAVMAGMTPDQAYSISVLIAGRNALAPKK